MIWSIIDVEFANADTNILYVYKVQIKNIFYVD